MPCACGQFIHYAHPFVIHSVSLRIATFDFITSSLLRFIHFTHLSTTRKSNSFLRFSHAIPQFHSVLQFAFSTLDQTHKQINRTTFHTTPFVQLTQSLHLPFQPALPVKNLS
jgi:hypothetical protein